MFTNVFRTIYILRNEPYQSTISPQDRKTISRLFGSGAATFAAGFFIWNLDNIFCSRLTAWKELFGWPGAFLLEGHSWWHILTVSNIWSHLPTYSLTVGLWQATGTYLMLVGNTCACLCSPSVPCALTGVVPFTLLRVHQTCKYHRLSSSLFHFIRLSRRTLGIKDSFSNYAVTHKYGLPGIERIDPSEGKTKAKTKVL